MVTSRLGLRFVLPFVRKPSILFSRLVTMVLSPLAWSLLVLVQRGSLVVGPVVVRLCGSFLVLETVPVAVVNFCMTTAVKV